MGSARRRMSFGEQLSGKLWGSLALLGILYPALALPLSMVLIPQKLNLFFQPEFQPHTNPFIRLCPGSR